MDNSEITLTTNEALLLGVHVPDRLVSEEELEAARLRYFLAVVAIPLPYSE